MSVYERTDKRTCARCDAPAVAGSRFCEEHGRIMADGGSVYECEVCGDKYTVGVDGDPFTTLTVSYHDDDRVDWSESVCQDCGDELLAPIVAELGVDA